jgi:hypothetical protein
MAAAPAWLLTTEEGKTHRFRDPTTLQKWIVERRVGRNDRVIPPGATARRLGDMDELRPFFDLVDQADRAAAGRVARPTQPETPQRRSVGGPGYSSPDIDDDDALMSGRRSHGGQRGSPRYSAARLDSDIAVGLSDMGMDDSIGVMLPQRNYAKKAFFGLVIAGLAVGAWYLGSRSGSAKNLAASAPAPSAPLVAPLPSPPPSAPPASAAAPAAAAAPAPTAAPPPAAPLAVAPAPPTPPAAARTPPAEEPPSEPVPPSRSSGRAAAAEPSPRGRGYEALVAEADRALEHGNTAKAQKYIDEALRLQPSGVAAVTSSAYLLLDRQKPLAAIGEFKRALNLSPNFPQALFGLGEAYRTAGNPGQAVEAYKKYLEAAPGGGDAPAARRQVRELESQPARPGHSATSNVPAQGNVPPPMPEQGPPP